jgi:CheY-like chemotaxis protein
MPLTTILVVDDEESVRLYIRRILAAQGWQIKEAGDGLDAMRKIEGMGAPLDLLLTDIRMPRMDGIELARAMIQTHPHTAVLYISGYPFDVKEEQSRNPQRICAFLPKPFTPKALVEAVKQCLAPAQNASCA